MGRVEVYAAGCRFRARTGAAPLPTSHGARNVRSMRVPSRSRVRRSEPVTGVSGRTASNLTVPRSGKQTRDAAADPKKLLETRTA